VFVVGDVAELVAEAAGGADGLVDVAVGVAVDPVVDSAVGDVVGQFDGECAVDAAALKLRGNQLIGRYVVGDDDLVLGLAGVDGLLDEVEAALMLVVEIRIPQQALPIDDAVKVGHASLGDEGVVHRPQGSGQGFCRVEEGRRHRVARPLQVGACQVSKVMVNYQLMNSWKSKL